MITQHIKVIGRVQGIGYRRWAVDTATKLNLSGWVRNLSDGSVEIMVQGETSDVNQFLSACLKGPVFASVLGIQPVNIPSSATPPIEKGTFKAVASF